MQFLAVPVLFDALLCPSCNFMRSRRKPVNRCLAQALEGRKRGVCSFELADLPHCHPTRNGLLQASMLLQALLVHLFLAYLRVQKEHLVVKGPLVGLALGLVPLSIKVGSLPPSSGSAALQLVAKVLPSLPGRSWVGLWLCRLPCLRSHRCCLCRLPCLRSFSGCALGGGGLGLALPGEFAFAGC